MADNFTANPGSGGSVFASDDISSVHYPRVKVSHGADGAATDVSTASPMPAQVIGQATGGCSVFRSIDLDESEEDVKGSAGTVYGIWFSNTATATRFLHLYNDTATNVTVGSTTPRLTIAIPGNTSDDVSGVFSIAQGIAFGTAISAAATTTLTGADAPGANEVIVNIFYV